MVFGVLVLRPAVNRIANIVLGTLYAVTIVAGAIGEWNYYILASAIEVALLAAVIYYASTWPTLPGPSSEYGGGAYTRPGQAPIARPTSLGRRLVAAHRAWIAQVEDEASDARPIPRTSDGQDASRVSRTP